MFGNRRFYCLLCCFESFEDISISSQVSIFFVTFIFSCDEIIDIFENDFCFPKLLLRQYEANLDEIYQRIGDQVKRLSVDPKSELIARFMKHAGKASTFGATYYKLDDANNELKVAINSKSIVIVDMKNIYIPKKVRKPFTVLIFVSDL